MTTTSEKIPQAYAARLSTPFAKPYKFTTPRTDIVPHPLATVVSENMAGTSSAVFSAMATAATSSSTTPTPSN